MTDLRATHHVGLTVASLAASREFYMGRLGFEEVFSWNPTHDYIGTLVGYPAVDLHACILRLPNTDVSLELLEYRGVERVAIDSRNANPGCAHLAFKVDDLDAIYAAWTAAGVASVSAPVTPTQGPNAGGRVVYMIDPDGVRIELIQSTTSFADYGAEAAC
jgi:lactoylglutathione lyase